MSGHDENPLWRYAERLQPIINELAEEDGTTDGGVVTKFVVIAEVLGPQGKTLHVYRGPEPNSIPLWDVQGMMFNLLNAGDGLFIDQRDEPTD